MNSDESKRVQELISERLMNYTPIIPMISWLCRCMRVGFFRNVNFCPNSWLQLKKYTAFRCLFHNFKRFFYLNKTGHYNMKWTPVRACQYFRWLLNSLRFSLKRFYKRRKDPFALNNAKKLQWFATRGKSNYSKLNSEKRDLLKELTIFDEEFSYQVAEPSLAMLAVGLIAMLTKHS